MKPHIVVVAARGEVVRNFLYSRTLDVLASEARVTILSVVCDDGCVSVFRDRCEQIIPLESVAERRTVRVLRQLLEYSHERYLWSQPAQVRWRKRNARYHRFPERATWTAKRLLAGACGNRAGLMALSHLERLASNALEPKNNYPHLWQRLQPDLVFNGSHIHSPTAILPMQSAARLGLETATFVFSWDNLTSRGRIFFPYDHYLLWNDRMRAQLLSLYPAIRPHQATVTGTPQFDYHFDADYFWAREDFCRRVGADPARPIVLYTTGMPHYMPEEPRLVAGIAAMLRQMQDLGRPQLLVRVYPKDQTGRFEPLKQELPDVLFPEVPWERQWLTPSYEDLFLLTNTLRHAAVGINVASTVSLELAMLDKPVINPAYDPPGADIRPVRYADYYDFDHYRPVVESGAVQVAYNEAELADMLRQALLQPAARSRERQRFVQQFFGPYLDGRSGERVAQCLLELARGTQSF